MIYRQIFPKPNEEHHHQRINSPDSDVDYPYLFLERLEVNISPRSGWELFKIGIEPRKKSKKYSVINGESLDYCLKNITDSLRTGEEMLVP